MTHEAIATDTPVPGTTVTPDEKRAELVAGKKRAELVAGLRELADFVDSWPLDLPLPHVHAIRRVSTWNRTRTQIVEELAAIHAALDGAIIPERFGDFELARSFPGDIFMRFETKREDVCTPEIVDGELAWKAPDLGQQAPAEVAA